MTDEKKISQLDKFKEAARQLECDDDPAHWDAALKKVVKPAPKAQTKTELKPE